MLLSRFVTIRRHRWLKETFHHILFGRTSYRHVHKVNFRQKFVKCGIVQVSDVSICQTVSNQAAMLRYQRYQCGFWLWAQGISKSGNSRKKYMSFPFLSWPWYYTGLAQILHTVSSYVMQFPNEIKIHNFSITYKDREFCFWFWFNTRETSLT